MPASPLLWHIHSAFSPSARYFKMVSHILPNTDISVLLPVITRTPDCRGQVATAFWSLLALGTQYRLPLSLLFLLIFKHISEVDFLCFEPQCVFEELGPHSSFCSAPKRKKIFVHVIPNPEKNSDSNTTQTLQR